MQVTPSTHPACCFSAASKDVRTGAPRDVSGTWACQAGQDLASTHLFRSLRPLLGTLVRCRATEGQAFASGKEAGALNKITQPVPSFQSTG